MKGGCWITYTGIPPTGTYALVEHISDKGNTHLAWDIYQTRDTYILVCICTQYVVGCVSP